MALQESPDEQSWVSVRPREELPYKTWVESDSDSPRPLRMISIRLGQADRIPTSRGWLQVLKLYLDSLVGIELVNPKGQDPFNIPNDIFATPRKQLRNLILRRCAIRINPLVFQSLTALTVEKCNIWSDLTKVLEFLREMTNLEQLELDMRADPTNDMYKDIKAAVWSQGLVELKKIQRLSLEGPGDTVAGILFHLKIPEEAQRSLDFHYDSYFIDTQSPGPILVSSGRISPKNETKMWTHAQIIVESWKDTIFLHFGASTDEDEEVDKQPFLRPRVEGWTFESGT